MNDELLVDTIKVLRDTLRLGPSTDAMNGSTRLLGGLPEFDSMAVVSVLAALEEHHGIAFEDEEMRAESFETVATLVSLLETKLAS